MDLSKIVVPEDAVEAKPLVTCVVDGILDEGDLRELALSAPTEPVEGDDPADLKRIKEKHHSVARMIASGLSQKMVGTLCGYTESYLSILLNNPAMKELVELYRIQQGQASQLVTEKLKTVGLKALEKLEEKLDNPDSNLSNQELLAAAKLGLDRAGHGPSSSHHVIGEQHIIDHAELQRMNEAARQRNSSRVIPAAEIRAALPAPSSEQNGESSETNRTVGPQSPELHEARGEQRGEGQTARE